MGSRAGRGARAYQAGGLGEAATSFLILKCKANKSAKGKKETSDKLQKQYFTSFIGGNVVHVFASGSYFSPELRVCLFSSWPPYTNKNPSAKN